MLSSENSSKTFCGFITLIGRPNVGKSTLLNKILKKKIAITSAKPQTTRHQLQGIKTDGDVQMVFVDTPGIHLTSKKALNRYMNKTARSALSDVDVIVFLVEATKWTSEDEHVLALIKKNKANVILAVNKVDKIKNKDDLLIELQQLSEKHNFINIFPISALKGDNVDQLEKVIRNLLPQGAFCYPEEQCVNRGQNFMLSEMVREKLMRSFEKEVPYSTTVEIEQAQIKNNILHVSALIWVERDGQKKIIIGKQGSQLKEIGTSARLDMEKYFGQKVMLKLWVKVKAGWSENINNLEQLGYCG